jgi:methionyl-tRNA formyltransferase
VIDDIPIDTQPGQVCEVNTKYCCVATGEKALSLIEVQPEGKSAMKIEEWLNGARLNIESLFGV